MVAGPFDRKLVLVDHVVMDIIPHFSWQLEKRGLTVGQIDLGSLSGQTQGWSIVEDQGMETSLLAAAIDFGGEVVRGSV